MRQLAAFAAKSQRATVRRTRACRAGSPCAGKGCGLAKLPDHRSKPRSLPGQWALGYVSRVPLQGSRIPGQRVALRLLSVPERRHRHSRPASGFVTSRKHTFRDTVIDLSPVSSGAKRLRPCAAASLMGVGASANTLVARDWLSAEHPHPRSPIRTDNLASSPLLCALRQHWLGG